MDDGAGGVVPAASSGALEAMLEEQRTSRFRRALRDLKVRLLEGA